MQRNVASGGVFLLAALGLLLSLTLGRTQTDLSGRPTPEMQQMANNILQSPAAAYLSGAGRNALELVAGQLPVPQGLRRAQALQSRMPTAALPLAPAVPGAEVMVNNPALDTAEPFDISTQSETAVAGFGGNIVVAYNNSATFRPTVMGYSLSTDAGLTFADLRGLPSPSGGLNLGDPGLVADRMGNFYVSSIALNPARPAGFAFTVGISKSTDGGSTFSIPVSPPAAGVSPGSFQDKEFIAVDTSGGPFGGNVYVTWTSFPPSGVPVTKLPILFSRSTDGGATFSTPIQISTSTEFDQGSEPVVGPNGEIYVAWERFFDLANLTAPSAIVVAKSTDGGMSFGSPVVAAPVTDIGFGGGTMLGNFRVNSFPRIDVSPTTGTVYIVFASNPQSLPPTPPTGDSGDIFFTRSLDGGMTWDPPTKLNDDTTLNDQFFPDIAVNGDGVLEVFWYDRRNDPGNVSIDLFETRSADDGVSFTANAQVNAVSFPPAVGYDPVVVRTYMGDYIDIKAITTSTGRGSTFLMAWGDNRRSVATFGGTRHDQDVFFAKD